MVHRWGGGTQQKIVHILFGIERVEKNDLLFELRKREIQ